MKKLFRTGILPLVSGLVLVITGWALGLPPGRTPATTKGNLPQALPTVTATPVKMPLFSYAATANGIERLAQLHTERPERPRFQVMRYTIQKGDTAWFLAQKFDLNIESILCGNEGMRIFAFG